MNRTSKLIAGAVLCAGLVQVACARKISIELIKKDPKANLEYVILHEQGLPMDERDSYTLVKDGKKISFEDTDLINNLYVKKSNKAQVPTHMLDLNKPPRDKDFDVVLLQEEGPGYGKKKYELGLRKQKTESKKQRG